MISVKNVVQRLCYVVPLRCHLPRVVQRLSIKRMLFVALGVGLLLFVLTAPYNDYYSSITAMGPRQRRALVSRPGSGGSAAAAAVAVGNSAQQFRLSPKNDFNNNDAAVLLPPDDNNTPSPDVEEETNEETAGENKRVLNFPSFLFGGRSQGGAAKVATTTTVRSVWPQQKINNSSSCNAVPVNPIKADFDTKKLVQQLTRLNSDGGRGVWSEYLEQGYEERLSRDPLPVRVVLLPFSHVDPGWLKTVVAYFDDSTGPTLEHMLEQLEQRPQMKFIWSEMSYFSMWWSRIDHKKKERLRAVIRGGQLEFVNGGFVMTDEAAAHFYAIIHQYVTGHQFLYDNLNVTVKHGWSIDPFGYSATLPYLYSQLGFHTNYIQRIHYNIKEYLARNRALQFRWQQRWASSSSSSSSNSDTRNDEGLFTYMAPTFLYTIRESCGPHRDVCREFDFKTNIAEWYHARNEPISERNIQQKAQMLVEEYSRMASLFDHKVYLHLLGDDFRFDKVEEWNQQFTNYELLKNYINNHTDSFNVIVEWGTLDTYYTRIKQSYAKLNEFKHQQQQSGEKDRRGGSNSGGGGGGGVSNVVEAQQQVAATAAISAVVGLPRLQGDFHVYADKYMEYWSGYYTTRPFVKRLSRELEWRLRNAEILASAAGWVAPHTQSRLLDPEDEWRLKLAAEALGLFQHHDAITGTSKAHVMVDYATRLLSGLDSSALVIANSARRLLEASNDRGESFGPDDITVDYQRPDVNSLPQKFLLDVKRNRVERILVYNSLTRMRMAVVKIHCNAINVDLLNSDGQKLEFQINPVWTGVDTISSEAFEIVFFAHLEPLSLTPFTIRQRPSTAGSSSSSSKNGTAGGFLTKTIPDDIRQRMVSLAVSNAKLTNRYFPQETFPSDLKQDVVIENDFLSLYFSARDGMLQSYALKNSSDDTFTHRRRRRRRARVSLMKYSTARSGAYLFMPLDAAYPLIQQPLIVRIIRGPLISQVDVVFPENIIHKVRLQHVAHSIHGAYVDVENIFNIAGMSNNELIMRINTDIAVDSPTSSSPSSSAAAEADVVVTSRPTSNTRTAEGGSALDSVAQYDSPLRTKRFVVRTSSGNGDRAAASSLVNDANQPPQPLRRQTQQQVAAPPLRGQIGQTSQPAPPPPLPHDNNDDENLIPSPIKNLKPAPDFMIKPEVLQQQQQQLQEQQRRSAAYIDLLSPLPQQQQQQQDGKASDSGDPSNSKKSAVYSDWYADANGFQMMPRRTSRHLPIQANYYPITTQAYVEADNRRMTIHVSEAHGAASLQPGELEIMLDRRLNQDDARGMGEPVVDSRATQQFMRIVFENVDTIENDAADSAAPSSQTSFVSNPTLLGQLINQDLNSPVELLLVSANAPGVGSFSSNSLNNNNLNDKSGGSGSGSGKNVYNNRPLHAARRPIACDTHLLMMRPLASKSASSTSGEGVSNIAETSAASSIGLILQRFGVQCCSNNATVKSDGASTADRFVQQLLQKECGAGPIYTQSSNNIADLLPKSTTAKSAKQQDNTKFSFHPSAINFITPEDAPQMFAANSEQQIKLAQIHSPTSAAALAHEVLAEIEPMNLAAFVLKIRQRHRSPAFNSKNNFKQ